MLMSTGSNCREEWNFLHIQQSLHKSIQIPQEEDGLLFLCCLSMSIVVELGQHLKKANSLLQCRNIILEFYENCSKRPRMR